MRVTTTLSSNFEVGCSSSMDGIGSNSTFNGDKNDFVSDSDEKPGSFG